ncbi:tRNA nucleotidyltransferase [Cavenderia fasciculata]|uniref:tRNA nucleotidyltransferase n=1 Tax=Cavenderia fasciculata TaxID=261658 RepID=F4PN51_CACFS|nr:tRNA nucleotidyltransferase [Cavenderia fasciculata]EGG23741.1 tRNA nucleotidyltransferase [Cavenderia fasciculata]|eukprot:XP_004361592.1 tRNA nucleotidyltransferase [Cavenderia fasciculata]
MFEKGSSSLSPLSSSSTTIVYNNNHKHLIEKEESQQEFKKRMKTKVIPITQITKDQQSYNPKYYHSVDLEAIDKDTKEFYNVVVAIGDKDSTDTATIEITKVEQKLFQILLDVAKVNNCNTTLRVAGGWVRDKLRGDNSHDIDIALDNMMGEAFAALVNKYLEDHHQETHRIGVIQSNPDQSKHLETATVKIFDSWVDLVNLRSETYSSNSRIPEIKIGTPEQDAFRRDLTINSLFYNVNENRIEDFTGNGIVDLKCGIVRTPLPPLTTFLDDPLRVLRSIRFATRLYYAIDHKLVEAASNPTVKEALKSKVSHERIGIELDGMLNGPRPDLAIQLIYEFGLFDHVINIPDSIEIQDKEYKYKSILNVLNMMRFINWGTQAEEASTRKTRLLASLCANIYGYTFKNPLKKNKDTPILQHVLVDYLKVSNKECDEITNVLECAKLFRPLVNQFYTNHVFSRKSVGLVIYKAGPFWKSSLAIALISELPEFQHNLVYPLHKEEINNSPSHDFYLHLSHPNHHHPPLCDESKDIEIKYDQFCATVANHDLVGVWNIKKLLNGKQVMDMLQRKPGEWLTPLLQDVFEWQLDNPQLGEKECKEYVLSKFSPK